MIMGGFEINYKNFLAAVGIFTLTSLFKDTVWNLLQFSSSVLAPYFLSSDENVNLAKKYGDWALVTGATDGIGKEYAKELARRNINIILVSRNEEKLQNTAREIEMQSPTVKTRIIAVDFSQGPKAIEIVKEKLVSLPPVGILVNNVGKAYEYPRYLTEVPEQELWDIININIGATTMMTKLIINDMKERGRGAVVNISSGAELQPLPLFTVYSASKVYVKYLTEALREEYSKYGITIQRLSPYFINTKMNHFSSQLQETSFFVPDAATYAKFAIGTLGKVDHSTGYWTHDIQYFISSIAPMWMRIKLGKQMMLHFRKDYLNNQRKISQKE